MNSLRSISDVVDPHKDHTVRLQLDSIKKETARVIEVIKYRFPKEESPSLLTAAYKLDEIARNAEGNLERLRKSTRWLWLLMLIVLTVLFTAVYTAYNLIQIKEAAHTLSDVLQGIESAIQDFMLVGAAIWFGLKLDSMYLAWRISPWLDDLRNIAHVVDMYQLNKNPDEYIFPFNDHKLRPSMTIESEQELAVYLGICSKMVSLVSKIAAVLSQEINDHDLRESAASIQLMCDNLSQKFWQKILTMDILIESIRTDSCQRPFRFYQNNESSS